MKYWQVDPPTHVILAMRYLERKKPQAAQSIDPMADLQQVSAMTGMQPEQMPAALLEQVRWAEEQKAKIGS